MSWLKLIIESDAHQADALSDALLAAGAGSVTLEDSADQPLFEPPPGETPLWSATRIMALFEANTDMECVLNSLPHIGTHRVEVLEDRDWIRAWMDHFKPMQFGERLWIIPDGFDTPDPDGVNIQLDPGLAFGTGTHPTTALCLEWLDAHPPAGKVVVDYGCGSGVLALAAALLGASRIIAVDNDPQALIATRANAEKNGVSDRIEVYAPETTPELQAELILANILAGPLVELKPILSGFRHSGSDLVLSGILHGQHDRVSRVYAEHFGELDVTVKEDWVRLHGKAA